MDYSARNERKVYKKSKDIGYGLGWTIQPKSSEFECGGSAKFAAMHGGQFSFFLNQKTNYGPVYVRKIIRFSSPPARS